MRKIVGELNKKSKSELLNEIKSLRESIAIARLERKSSNVKDTNIISKKRKQLAIALTLINKKTEESKS